MTIAFVAIVAFTIGAIVAALIIGKQKSELRYENGVLKTNIVNAEQKLHDQSEAYSNQLELLKSQQKEQIEQLRTQHREDVEQQLKYLKEQMNSESEKILLNRKSQLEEANRDQLSKIVDPLQTEIKRMQEMVERAGREHSTTMERLDATIKTNMTQAENIGQKADRLAQALLGENKTQGNFGELKLKQLLDDMGFEEGIQYEQQATMKDVDGKTAVDNDGSRLQPDVILHFPDERDVIIDSKISFTAVEEYYSTTDESARKEALKRHVASVRAHVNELSRKEYFKYQNGKSQDFVVMYMYSESALQLALSADPTLYKEAYDKRVIICGSNNLYALLRVLETSWKQMRQVESQQKMIESANRLVERVQIFCERFSKVEDCLKSTQNAIDDVKTVTADHGQSIITSAKQLVKYGASQSKKHRPLPETSPEDSATPELEEKG